MSNVFTTEQLAKINSIVYPGITCAAMMDKLKKEILPSDQIFTVHGDGCAGARFRGWAGLVRLSMDLFMQLDQVPATIAHLAAAFAGGEEGSYRFATEVGSSFAPNRKCGSTRAPSRSS